MAIMIKIKISVKVNIKFVIYKFVRQFATHVFHMTNVSLARVFN
jgi:hypothetical protein